MPKPSVKPHPVTLTVLVDNNTLIDRYFRAEPGFSLLIEYGDQRILFDTGYSDLFLVNAEKMGKDLSRLDALVLSHSHLDHTWGLDPFVRYLTERSIEGLPLSRPRLIGHPGVFSSAGMAGIPEFGCLMSREKLGRHLEMTLSREPFEIAPGVVFLGEIPRSNDFEGKETFGRKEGEDGPDRVMEDSALALKTDRGLVVITGCAHAGICNTVAHAVAVCKEPRVADVIGGFHLLDPAPDVLERTVAFLKDLSPGAVHACHCTDLSSKTALAGAVNLQEVGVGLCLEYRGVSS